MSKQISEHAAVAKLIRKYLKSIGVKASVRSESYAGGNSVDVYLNDMNPEFVKEIEKECKKYQRGHFNGMEDIYEYSNTNKDIPQVKFVFVNNEKSLELKQSAWNFLQANMAGFDELPNDYESARNKRIESLDEYVDLIVYRFLSGGQDFGNLSKEFWNQKEAV